MRFGLITSVILHVVILAWALITIQSQRELRMPEPDPIVTGLITEGELTKLRQGVRTAKQLEAQAKQSPKADVAKKEAPKPTPVAAAPPPPEPPAPKEEVKPEPKPEPKKDPIAEKLASAPPPPVAAAPPPVPAPEEQKKLEEMLKEQERQAEEQKKAEEQKQAELKKKLDEAKKRKDAELKEKREKEKKRREAEAKKKFDAEKISALLNKIPDKGAPAPSSEPTEPTKAKGPALGAPEGRDRQLSASELAVLAQIIKSCVQSKWNVLGGGESAQHTQVKIRLRFKPDGSLNGAPVIMNPQSTAYFNAVSESAVRAVQACDPFNLPPEKYDFWKDMVLNFDPRDMF